MTTSAAPAPRALGSATLAAYAAPQLALAALYFPVFVYLAPVYANDRGVPLEQLGIVLILVRLVDAVTDPAMGALSDRLRTR
ncbi:MAG: MFS transporter, partial [Pseudomonadota bacterium]